MVFIGYNTITNNYIQKKCQKYKKIQKNTKKIQKNTKKWSKIQKNTKNGQKYGQKYKKWSISKNFVEFPTENFRLKI